MLQLDVQIVQAWVESPCHVFCQIQVIVLHSALEHGVADHIGSPMIRGDLNQMSFWK